VTQTVTVTINGTNEDPVVAAALSASASEGDDDFTVDMLTGASDIDVGTTLSVANVMGETDGITVSGSTLTIDPEDAEFEYLAVGETLITTINYDVIDGEGGSTPQSVEVTITGTNDIPVVNAVTTNVLEDGPAITILPDFTDVDVLDTHTITVDTARLISLARPMKMGRRIQSH